MTLTRAGVLDAKQTPSLYVTSIALGLAACLIVAVALGSAALYPYSGGTFISPKMASMATDIALALVVALLLVVVDVTLVLRQQGRVSLLVFIDEVLAFWIYWLVLFFFVARADPYATFGVILVSSGLSVFTVYKLL